MIVHSQRQAIRGCQKCIGLKSRHMMSARAVAIDANYGV
jgi:hypothetical protein